MNPFATNGKKCLLPPPSPTEVKKTDVLKPDNSEQTGITSWGFQTLNSINPMPYLKSYFNTAAPSKSSIEDDYVLIPPLALQNLLIVLNGYAEEIDEDSCRDSFKENATLLLSDIKQQLDLNKGLFLDVKKSIYENFIRLCIRTVQLEPLFILKNYITF